MLVNISMKVSVVEGVVMVYYFGEQYLLFCALLYLSHEVTFFRRERMQNLALEGMQIPFVLDHLIQLLLLPFEEQQVPRGRVLVLF